MATEMAAEKVGKKGSSRCCLIAAGMCCCCCLVLGALGTAAGIIYSRYEEPSVGVDDVKLSKLELIQNSLGLVTDVKCHLEYTIKLDNPSKEPIEATLKKVEVAVHSLDIRAADKVGELALVGHSQLDKEVHIAAESVADINMNAQTTANTATNPNLFNRLVRDCGNALAAERKTRMRIHILEATVAVYGVNVNVDDIAVDFDVPCPQ